MKQFLKRAGALALSLLLLLGSSNLGLMVPAKAAVSNDARTAYRKFVRQMVDQYGIITEASGEAGSNTFHGVETVDFIDLTGDSVDEMIVTWTEPIRSVYERTGYLGIYTYSGGTVSELFHADFNAGTYANFAVFRQNSLIAAVYGESRMYENAIRWQNGRFLKVNSSDDFTASDWARVEAASADSGFAGESAMTSNIVMEHIGLDPSAPMERLLDVSRIMWAAEGTPDWVTTLDIYGADISGGPTTSVGQTLPDIAYIGDPAKSKMDAKMANAYADVLDSIQASSPSDKWCAALVDISGDGYPLMFIVALDPWSEFYIEEQVWEYKNEKALKHDFNKDFTSSHDNFDTFAIYDSQVGPLLGITFYGFNSIPNNAGGQYYKVSKGALTLQHTILGHVGYEAVSSVNWSIDGKDFSGSMMQGAPEGKLGLTPRSYLLRANSIAFESEYKFSSASAAVSALRAYADSTPNAPAASATNAVLSPQKLAVDGKSIECEKYNIGGSNYFKLRDLAYLLNGTGSQFGVGYNQATSTVSITTGAAYTSTGTELTTGVDNSSTAQPSSQSILIDGVKHDELTIYNIGGSNFFQLRELGNVLGFEVGYDQDTNTAIVRSIQK